MAKRTYVPQLFRIARALCDYLRRYDAQLRKALGPSGAPVISAALIACEALELAAIAFLEDDTKYPTEA